MAKIEKPKTQVVTGKVRFSYCNIFKARAMNEGEDAKFSTALLIRKTDTATLKKIERAVEAAKEQGKASKWSGTIPGVLKMPMRDGDIERPGDAAYKGMMFVNANSNNRPEVVDVNMEPIIDSSELVSGDWGRASVNFFPYAGKSKGIACGLNNVQLLAKGEPLSGGTTAASDFAEEFEDEEEDDMLS